jgi:hypothetical protein
MVLRLINVKGQGKIPGALPQAGRGGVVPRSAVSDGHPGRELGRGLSLLGRCCVREKDKRRSM